MPNLRLKGPRSEDTGPVKYRSTYLRSEGRDAAGHVVTINLGNKLRHSTGDRPKGEHTRGHETSQGLPTGAKHPHNGSLAPVIRSQQVAVMTGSMLTSTQAANTNGTALATGRTSIVQKAYMDTDSDSDLEILEERPAVFAKTPTLVVDNCGFLSSTTDNDDESELSSYDALSSPSTLPTQRMYVLEISEANLEPHKKPYPPIHKLAPDFYQPHKASMGPPPPGYRNIPPNLVYAIHRELNLWMDTSSNDDIEMMEKLVFTLKDPIVKTKIKLPIKSTTCRHFECFDFQTFCEFCGLNPGTKSFLRSTLLRQSKDAREAENKFLKQQQEIAAGTLLVKAPDLMLPSFSKHGQMFFTEIYNRIPPLYKCPLCDEKFGLKQLYISDIFNYFVKTTPLHIYRVQLEGSRFKIIEDDHREEKNSSAQVVDLSEEEDKEEDKEEEEEESGSNNSDGSNGKDKDKDAVSGIESTKSSASLLSEKASRSTTEDEFNDGLDDVLLTINKGDGSWSHPVTLD